MTESKDIIKALECCKNNEKEGTCKYCSECFCCECELNESEEDNCYDVLFGRTITLIKNQQAEQKELWEERNRIYESLKETNAELEEYRKVYTTAQAEIERLKEKCIEDDKLLNDRVTESVNTVSKAHLKYENALEEQLKTSETRAYNKFADLMLELYEGDIIDEMNCPVSIIRQNIKDIRDKLIEEVKDNNGK